MGRFEISMDPCPWMYLLAGCGVLHDATPYHPRDEIGRQGPGCGIGPHRVGLVGLVGLQALWLAVVMLRRPRTCLVIGRQGRVDSHEGAHGAGIGRRAFTSLGV